MGRYSFQAESFKSLIVDEITKYCWLILLSRLALFSFLLSEKMKSSLFQT